MHYVIELSPQNVIDMFLFACALALVWPMILIATLGKAKKGAEQKSKPPQSQSLSKPNTKEPIL